MSLSRIIPRGNAKLWLFASVMVAMTLVFASDRTPASAATTELGPTLSATGTAGCGSVCAPAWAANASLLKGGRASISSTLQTDMTASTPSSINIGANDGAKFPSNGPFYISIGLEIVKISTRSGDTFTISARAQQGTTAAAHTVGNSIVLRLSPCWDGAAGGSVAYGDPATSCVYIWAKNVDATSTGASALQVEATYDSSKIHVVALSGSPVWLSSTGRGAGCVAGVIDEDLGTGAGHAATSCTTLGSTGAGPKCPSKCNGLLATMQIESVPNAPVGQTAIAISLSNGSLGGTFLLDLACTSHCGQTMPATLYSMTARIVKCANLIDDAGHLVLVNDIVYMVNRYRTHGDNFGTPPQPASPTWDERTDLDASNQILVNDITTAVNQYRKSCTP